MAYTTINKSTAHFDTRTYSASGGGSVSDVAFQPDFLWFKNRTVVGDHGLMDAIRGITKILHSNDGNTEATSNGSSDFNAFTSNGFNYGPSSALDTGSGTPCTWLWKAGGSINGNTNGNITSTTSVNNTAGFSIITYTGSGSNATIGHGLSTAPKMIIVKRRDVAANWQVYHGALAANKALELNGTGGSFTAANRWNSTAPTNTVFSVGNATEVNAQYGTYVAYCFSNIQGYSKFGSYIGTGNVDGPFIYTGFKPSLVLIKGSSNAGSWLLWDNKRSSSGGFNPNHYILVPNNNEVEQTGTNYAIDMVSNGFKLRNNNGNVQNSGQTAIYMAFGQSIVGTNNVPANAR